MALTSGCGGLGSGDEPTPGADASPSPDDRSTPTHAAATPATAAPEAAAPAGTTATIADGHAAAPTTGPVSEDRPASDGAVVGDAAQVVHAVRSGASAAAPSGHDGAAPGPAAPGPVGLSPNLAAGALSPVTLSSGASPAPPTLGLTAELTAEVLALRQGVGLWSLVGALALILLGWVASLLIHALIRLAHRLGAPRAPWVDNLGALARLLVWAWIVTSIVAGGWRLAPMITLLAAGVIATGLLVGLLRHVENLSTGIGLALRGRIKVGDQIAVGEHSGMVRAVGLMHLHLRVADGSTVYLPNRLLAHQPVAIGRARNSYPLRVRLARDGAWPPAAIETARWIAALSPYRDVNARVAVQIDGAEQSVLVVEIQVWSPRLLDAAEKHLRAMLAAHLGDEIEAPTAARAPLS